MSNMHLSMYACWQDLATQGSYAEALERERHAQRYLFDHPENPAQRGEDTHGAKFREATARRAAAKL